MKEKLEISYLSVFSLYCAVIPFTDLGEAIPNITLIVLLFLFPFVYKKEDWKKTQNKTFYALFILLLIIVVQSLALGRWDDFKFISRLALLCAIVIASIPIKNILIPMIAFVFGTFVLLSVSSINLMSYYFLYGKLDMTVGDQVSSILLGDRPYIGYVYVLSFCLSLYIARFVSKTKYLFYAYAILCFLFLLIISARISLISIVIIVLSYFLYSKNIKKSGFIALALGLFMVLMFIANPSLKKRFFISSNKYNIEQMVKFEPRYYIWTCGYHIFAQSNTTFVGKSFVEVNNQLENCYKNRDDFADSKQQDYFVRSKFNTHSQPLNFLLSTGVLSLILFLLIFVFWFKEDRKNYHAFILILSVFLFCLVENVLSRQMGAELFAIALVFAKCISRSSQFEDNNKKEVLSL